MAPLDRRRLDILIKLAKFIIVGSSGVVVNSAMLYFLFDVMGWHLIAASIFAVEVSIVNNYLWNNWWTFGRQALSFGNFTKFNMVSVGGLAITTSTLYALVTFTGLNYLVANLVGISLATLWNFGANFMWTWGGSG